MAPEMSAPTDDETNHPNIDPAALAGAALAATITLFVAPGPFVPLTAIIGTTLLLILLSYELRRPRTFFQCYAFGSVCAFCGLLAVGFGIEGWRVHWSVEEWERLMNLEESCVEFWDLTLAWVILMFVFSSLGWICRKRKSA
jgi:hypothetical protein